ncbi:hypothetical protein [Pseudooceanicola aestuarii]|uniref:hypothetical protein n=1 Tax=Pseudooceanicola aestuarii TaxID=2697319 RepID=UPI0013D1A082|nr:hypothetical protein [Pseudooceanicola aestuarii]
MTKNKPNSGGRPLSYRPEDVYAIVEELLTAGTPTDEITTTLVKDRLCLVYSASKSIRPEALQRLIDDAVEEFISERNDRLIADLPGSVKASLDDFMAGAHHSFSLMLAEQNQLAKQETDKRLDEVVADKRSAQWLITELEMKIETLEREKETISAERDHQTAEADGLRKKLAAANVEMSRLRGGNDMLQQMLNNMQMLGARSDEGSLKPSP